MTIAAETVGGRVPLLVGIGALRTDEAVRLAQDARAAGADAGLLAPVSYTPLTEAEVEAHFAAVAEAGGLPLVLYDNPATTHFRFTPALIGRIARRPGIVAAKCAAPEPAQAASGVAALRQAVPAGFPVGFSGDWNVTEALIAGGAAWFSVAGGLFPRTYLAIVRAVAAGEAERARALNAELEPLWTLFRTHSSLRVVYALADLMGLCRAEPPRPIRPSRRRRWPRSPRRSGACPWPERPRRAGRSGPAQRRPGDGVARHPEPACARGQTAVGAGSSTASTRASSVPRFRIWPLAATTA